MVGLGAELVVLVKGGNYKYEASTWPGRAVSRLSLVSDLNQITRFSRSVEGV